MATLIDHNAVGGTSQKHNEESNSIAFTIIFVSIFMLFMGVAILSTLLRLPWRSWFPGAEQSSSMIGGVKAAVYTLMSYLT
jgi:light-harvesting complex 1 beta chain